MLTYHEMTDAEREAACAWKYEGEYALYDLPSYADMKARGVLFGNPDTRANFLAYCDKDELVGFLNLSEEPTEVFVGLGVKPDRCGCGYGQQMLAIASEVAARRFPAKPLYLEVRTWNKRAVRCYERAGFAIDGEPFAQVTSIGEGVFYRMVKAALPA